MTIQGLNAEDRFVASSRDILYRHGVELTVGHDFNEYKEILATGRQDHDIGAPFDPRRHDLNASNAMWVIGRDEDGRVMHAQALRMLDLKGGTLASYMRRGFRQFPPSGLDLDMEKSRYKPGPGAKRISGRVVYHGEVWMGGEPGKYRGTGLSCILGRFAFLSAIRQFAPDYVIGFMPKQVAFKGFVERQGYLHAEPFALRWFMRGNPDPLEGFMVYMSDEDMRFVLDMPVSELEALAA
jgi:hypothetical protein